LDTVPTETPARAATSLMLGDIQPASKTCQLIRVDRLPKLTQSTGFLP
jgi:hypothetical protein